ncbi:hypothetical protein MKQ70_32345 [Chitinophaga sedimenti]|uniref:hypothetical protein n=1 Tax=Chitinophaga sedimenti TaxID=2033606 RepID=UPI002002AD9A|nr:hypothetical protein [Chitinophaga sedimenti]MCK7559408.1 hypothetical protein [Chitinophaga sedimenti]
MHVEGFGLTQKLVTTDSGLAYQTLSTMELDNKSDYLFLYAAPSNITSLLDHIDAFGDPESPR